MIHGTEVLRRSLHVGWKIALAAVIIGTVVYRLRFAPIPVVAQMVAVGPIVSEVMGTGTLEPRVQSKVGSKISGLLAQVLVDQGERVTKGQLIAVLDDSDKQKLVAMSEAAVQAAIASTNRAAADIASTKANAGYARSNYNRVAEMVPSGAVSKDEWEKATAQRDVADAQLNRAELAKVEADREVTKAEHALRYSQQQLADSRIVSPFDGLIVRRAVDPGTIVVPGSEIFQVISTEQIWISAWIDETAIAAVAPGQPARIVFRSEPSVSYSGTVTRVAPLADRETRELLVDVTVKELPRTWAIGQRAEVYIQTASKSQALLAPQTAVVWRQNSSGVFVNNSGHARWRNIELGLRSEHGGQVVEVLSGLEAGDVVISPRSPTETALTEGRAVSIP